MSIKCVCLLGLGEVGSILVEDLLSTATIEIPVWDRHLDRAESTVAIPDGIRKQLNQQHNQQA